MSVCKEIFLKFVLFFPVAWDPVSSDENARNTENRVSHFLYQTISSIRMLP